MSQATLRMTDAARIEAERMFLDRRRATRRKASGRVTAVASLPDGQRICSLQLRDISDTGIGAISCDPIESGTGLTIFFPPHGPERGFDLVGTVVRCDARQWGYNIGISLTTRQQRAA